MMRIFTIGLLALPMFFLAGNVSGQYHPDEDIPIGRKVPDSTAILGMARGEYVVFERISTVLMVNVIDYRDPCNIDGAILLSSSDCKIQAKSRTRFRMQPTADKGVIHVYYDIGRRMIHVGDIPFSTIPVDTLDPDFIAAHPKKEWQVNIDSPDNYSPDPERVEEDPNYVISMPFARQDYLLRNKPNEIYARFHAKKCLPDYPVMLEGRGLEIEKMEYWNEYRIKVLDDRKKASIRYYRMDGEEKVYLGKVEVPVLDQEPE